MKTEFKIFESDMGYSKIEDLIEEYQNKHHLEIKQVVVLRNDDYDFTIGVMFEKDMVSFFNRKYRDSCKSAITGFMSPPEPVGQ